MVVNVREIFNFNYELVTTLILYLFFRYLQNFILISKLIVYKHMHIIIA